MAPMTLILAGIAEETAILAADTKILNGSTPKGEKLFVVRGCGVASFGSTNPRKIPHFPTLIKSVLGYAVGPKELAAQLHELLVEKDSQEHVGLIVAGIAPTGPEFWEVTSAGATAPFSRLSIEPGKQACARGVATGTGEADGSSRDSLRSWMKGRFNAVAAESEGVGAPFQYVELRSDLPLEIREL